MVESNYSYVVENLLLKLSLCPQNEQIQIFQGYTKNLAKF